MAATDDLLSAALARDPAGPLVTFYDDATGERTELSATTVNNWVAKTANLLRDDIALRPGDRVAVLLPAHWQTAVVLLAAWAAGGVVTTRPDGAAVAFADPPRLDAAAAADEVVGLSLAPLGRGLVPPVSGVIDYAVEVRAHGDRFAGEVGPHAPALAGGEPGGGEPGGGEDGAGVDGAGLVGRARDRAGRWGLRAGDRLLCAAPWTGPDAWVGCWLAPLAAGASVVLCVNAPTPETRDTRDAADITGGRLAARARSERATATLGVTVPGLRRLDGAAPGPARREPT